MFYASNHVHLGKNLFYMSDYETACIHFLQGANGDHLWLGVTMLFHAVQMTEKLAQAQCKTDQAYNTLAIRRDKALSDAVKTLGSKCLIM